MSHGSSEQLVVLPKPVSPHSASLFIREIIDASYLGILYLHLLELTTGMSSKRHIFSHLPMKVTRLIRATTDGLQFNRLKGDLLAQYRMDCCLTPLYINYSMPMPSQLIRMHVCLMSILKAEANIYYRTTTSCGLYVERG
jgi:hypothetical protein